MVILTSVYGENDMQYALAMEKSFLTDEMIKLIHNSYPSQRLQHFISGCDGDGHFVSDYKDENGEMDEPAGYNGLRWKCVDDGPKFTTENHCIVLQASMNE